MSLSKLNTLWDDYLEQLDKNPLVTKVSSHHNHMPLLLLPSAHRWLTIDRCSLCAVSCAYPVSDRGVH